MAQAKVAGTLPDTLTEDAINRLSSHSLPDQLNEDEINRLAAAPADSLKPPDLPPYSMLGAQLEHYGRIGHGLVGAGKGLAETAYQLARLPVAAEAKALTAMAPVSKEGLHWDQIPWVGPTPEILKPKGEAQEMGKTFEQIAEYLVPSTWEAKVVSTLPKLSGLTRAVLPIAVRAVNQAAGSAGVNWLQGGTPEEIELAALLGGVGAGAADSVSEFFRRGGSVKTLVSLARRIGEYLPVVGPVIKPFGTAMEYLRYLFPKAVKDPYELDPFVRFSQLAKKREAQVPVLPTIGRAVPGREAMVKEPEAPPQPPPGIPENAPAQFVPSTSPTRGRIVIRRPGKKSETIDAYVDEQGRVRLGGGQGR